MNVMNEKEIRQRINAFKAAAESDGFDSTYGWWIILHETTKAKKNFNDAMPLRELLGHGDGAVSELSMKQHFGSYWRSKFTKQSDIGRGFIHRELSGCVFVSVDDGSARNDVPTRNNILRRSDPEVKAIRYFIKKHVVFGEADGSAEAEEAEAIDEGAMNVEAGGNDTGRPATADDLDSKTLKRILCHLRVDDMMHSAARVSPKWRKAALDVVVFQSSTTITQEKKRKLRSGAELHLK